jgi:K+ potassium transporter
LAHAAAPRCERANATIIASQAIITGSFSLTRQAMQLGWFPGVRIHQTSSEEYGQIYVPFVNWTMMVLTVALTISFGRSDRLAGAYGTAVSTTMLLTTALLYNVMRERWRWPVGPALTAICLFLAVDFAFSRPICSKSKMAVGSRLRLARWCLSSWNLTGITFFGTQLESKRLGLLHELVPRATLIAVLTNPSQPAAAAQENEVATAAGAPGLKVLIVHASSESELDTAFTTCVQMGVGGLLVTSDPLFFNQHKEILAVCARRILSTSVALSLWPFS